MAQTRSTTAAQTHSPQPSANDGRQAFGRGRSSAATARFVDRRDAGRQLAVLLGDYRHDDPLVAGITPDGMPVAAEVARTLDAPLQAAVVAAVIVGGQPQGVVGETGVAVVDQALAASSPADRDELQAAVSRARRQVAERIARFYAAGRRLAVTGRTVLLIDDWLASPARALAAAGALRARGAARLILAVPVSAQDAARELGDSVDELIAPHSAAQLQQLDGWYQDIAPTSEEEVVALLSEHTGAGERQVLIEADHATRLRAQLRVPWGAYARGVIVIACVAADATSPPAHQRTFADVLNRAGFATLSIGLHRAPGPSRTAALDDEALAAQLVAATRWLRRQPETARLAIGLLADGPAAGAALRAAARLRAGVGAVALYAAHQADVPSAGIVAPVLTLAGEPGTGGSAGGPGAEDPQQSAVRAAHWLRCHLSDAPGRSPPGSPGPSPQPPCAIDPSLDT